MKIKSTLIILSLVLGLMSCSYNSGVLKEAQPATKTTLKSSILADSSHITFHFRGINNLKFDKNGKPTTVFDSAGGLLTKIIAVQEIKTQFRTISKRIVIWDTPEEFDDLLTMGTGMMGDLVLLNIPSGVYNYVIVDVSHGWAAKDGIFYPVQFFNNQMILYFNPPVTVGEHLSPDLIFNIDVSKSFIPMYGGTWYLFRPIVYVQNATTSGSLAGVVIDVSNYQPITNANVYVDVNGQQYSGTTVSDTTVTQLGDTLYPGQYWIPGIPPGTYTAHASKEGYVSTSAQVSIMKGNYYFQNFVLVPNSSSDQ